MDSFCVWNELSRRFVHPFFKSRPLLVAFLGNMYQQPTKGGLFPRIPRLSSPPPLSNETKPNSVPSTREKIKKQTYQQSVFPFSRFPVFPGFAGNSPQPLQRKEHIPAFAGSLFPTQSGPAAPLPIPPAPFQPALAGGGSTPPPMTWSHSAPSPPHKCGPAVAPVAAWRRACTPRRRRPPRWRMG